ncbi:MAG: O-antigen ligase family protein [Candidatus Uhrbacteria bacterium]
MFLIAIAFIAYAFLAWLRPCIALGVLLASIPFYEITRFTVAGIPFTFPEAAVYVLAGVVMFSRLLSSFRTREAGEKSHTMVPPSNGVRSFVRSNFPSENLDGFRMTKWWSDPWIVLPFFWVIVAFIAAIGSPAGLRAWGIWKAYFVVPVILFWIVRWVFQQPMNDASTSSLLSFRAPTGSRSEESRTTVLSNNDVRSLAGVYPDFTSGLGMTLRVTFYFLLPIAASALIVAAIAVVQRWFPIGVPYPWSVPGQFRATSVFGYPNAVGLFLGPLVPLIIGLVIQFRSSFRAKSEESHNRVLAGNGVRSLAGVYPDFTSGLGMTIGLGMIAVPPLLAIILAKSTGALIALAVVAIVGAVFVMWRPRIQRPHAWAIGIILAWVLASIVITGALPYKRDLERIQNPIVRKIAFGAWSGSVRLEQYRETWVMLRDHPIRGVGLAAYQTAFAPYHHSTVEIFPYPHNLLLAVWSELGLAGAFIFLAILYQFFRHALITHHSSLITYSAVAAMLVLLVHGLVDVPYFKNDLAMMFWVIVAIGTLRTTFGTIQSYGSVASGLRPGTPNDC